MDALIHFANLLLLGSYLVRDMLWLRLLSILAGACFIIYFYFAPVPVWAPICWNLLFMTLNAYRIQRLLAERRPVRLTDEEQRLYGLTFRSLTPREFLRLARLAEWHDATAAQCLVEEGQRLTTLVVIFSGSATVKVAGEAVARLADGRLCGEMSFLTGEKTSASVWTDCATRYVEWRADELRRFLDENAELRSALQLVIGGELAQKLRRSARAS